MNAASVSTAPIANSTCAYQGHRDSSGAIRTARPNPIIVGKHDANCSGLPIDTSGRRNTNNTAIKALIAAIPITAGNSRSAGEALATRMTAAVAAHTANAASAHHSNAPRTSPDPAADTSKKSSPS